MGLGTRPLHGEAPEGCPKGRGVSLLPPTHLGHPAPSAEQPHGLPVPILGFCEQGLPRPRGLRGCGRYLGCPSSHWAVLVAHHSLCLNTWGGEVTSQPGDAGVMLNLTPWLKESWVQLCFAVPNPPHVT